MERAKKTIQASAGVLLLLFNLSAHAEPLPEYELFDSSVMRGETADGTWLQAEELLGHEREQGPVSAGWRIAWDGMDNDPGSLDIGGLGGSDLTEKDSADRFILNWSEPLTQARWVEVTVWTTAQQVSRTRLVNLMDNSSGQIEIPFHVFEGNADFRNVGAVEITIGALSGALPNFQRLTVAPKDFSEGAEGLGTLSEMLTNKGAITPAVPATLILQEGDMPSASAATVTELNAPVVNGNGEVSFLGVLSDDDRFVFTGTGLVHQNSTVTAFTLTDGERSIGVDSSGGFIYSPRVDDADAVWSQNGLILVENTQAPGFPTGTNSTFHSRPSMISTGAAYWVAGFNETGGTDSEGRVLYTSSDATAGNVSVVLRSDDIVDGFAIARPSGVDFDFDISSDGSQHISVLVLDTGSLDDDGVLYVNGSIIARESTPSGADDNWDNFDSVVINDSGDYLFSGDTDGDTVSDEFIAFNGVIALREGDTIDGVQLGDLVRFVSLNNQGNAAYAWAQEHLFFACDASALASTSLRVLSVGDTIDLDDDGLADATVTDFKATNTLGPTQALAPDGRMFVEVDLDDGVEEREAIIALEPPLCPQPEIEVTGSALLIEDGDTSPQSDDGTDFGLVTTGSSLVRSFVIRNSGNDPLMVTDVAVSGVAFSVSALAPDGLIEADDSRSFEVTFSPTTEGPLTGTVTIASDDADENPYTFDVLGIGLAPSAPVIASNDGFTVLPSAAVGSVVGQIVASDADGNIPATGAWSIVAGNDAGTFSINDDGVIAVADPAGLASVTLTVRVVDSTDLSDTASVNIALAEESIFFNGFE
ncbi:MAG: choice-of-anchor D domain-containing protein [Lysobacterales bacterium]